MNGRLAKQRLIELGLSPEELAVKMQVSIATVYNMLGGRRLSDRNIFRASQVLGVSVDELQGGPAVKRRA